MTDPKGPWIRCWTVITVRLARALSFAIACSISASRAIVRPGLLVALIPIIALSAMMVMAMQGDTIADRVLGQLNFSNSMPNFVDASGLSRPDSVRERHESVRALRSCSGRQR